MIEQEIKEERYTLAIKLKQIHDSYKAIKYGNSDGKWGIRADYYSSSRVDVKKFNEVNGGMYKAIKDCTTYSGESKTVNANRIKSQLKYWELEKLCSFPTSENSNLTDYFIITHGNKYSAFNRDENKAVLKINPYVQNDNYFTNALVVDMTELKRLFNNIKEEWKEENAKKTDIANNEKNVLSLVRKSRRLEMAIKEAETKFEKMEERDKKTTFTIQDFNNYNLSKDKDFLLRLGDKYIDSTYSKLDAPASRKTHGSDEQYWDDIATTRRKVEVYQNYITNTYSDYMHDTFDITVKDLLKAKNYIELTFGENELPKIKNPHDYNTDTSSYNSIGIHNLPNLTFYASRVEELEVIKIKIKELRNKMTMKMLSFLNPRGEVVVCDVKPQFLITIEEEE